MSEDSLITTTQSNWGAKPQAITSNRGTETKVIKTQDTVMVKGSNLVPLQKENKKILEDSDIGFVDRVKERIRKEEGLRLDAYRPVSTEKHFTQGYGRYGSSIVGGSMITKEQAEKWLDEDVAIRVKAINKRIPRFNKLPADTKDALFSSWYRGGLSGSPKTLNLINKGKFEQAAKSFLHNAEYNRLKRTGRLRGVVERMERVSESLRALGKHGASVKTSDQINHFMQGE